jgi:hypothetical protein
MAGAARKDVRLRLRFLTRQSKENSLDDFCSELVFDSVAMTWKPLLGNLKGYEVSPAILSFSPYLQYLGRTGE